MVLADQIYTDAMTGKRVICGTFSHLGVEKIPGVFVRSTFAFILLSDIEGKFRLSLRFVHLKDNAVLLQSEPIEFTAMDRLGTTDLVIEVPPFPIVAEGYYSLECWVEEYLVGSVRLAVTDTTKRGKQS